ncbi:hypothetical protein GCM10007881_04100 [Mesorhizobium huakuii]|uniref:hypothetical protein n=1 Tax=Mesorhizobium huakuii TaxID=28104 RepID=UPI00235D2DBA|nr:hypothetical protein [Mesorhizobium huakuii]GLQ76894.1 hypothetical protein GCM10007881_04100 [Mesorhizobium huakuii]
MAVQIWQYIARKAFAHGNTRYGRFGFLVDHSDGECFIEPHSLPTDTPIAIAAATHLVDAHGVIPCLGDTNDVDLYHSKEAVIANLKAFALA